MYAISLRNKSQAIVYEFTDDKMLFRIITKDKHNRLHLSQNQFQVLGKVFQIKTLDQYRILVGYHLNELMHFKILKRKGTDVKTVSHITIINPDNHSFKIVGDLFDENNFGNIEIKLQEHIESCDLGGDSKITWTNNSWVLIIYGF